MSASLQRLLPLLMRLCLVLAAILLTATHAAAATCQDVNTDLGSGRTLTVADIPGGSTNRVQSWSYSLNAGEKVTWQSAGTQDGSGNTWALLRIFTDTTDPYADADTSTGSFSRSGTYTAASGGEDIYMDLEVNRNNTETSGASVTLTASCSAATASTNANLSNLSLSSGTLSPSFASGTTSYTASVANGVSTITATPTVSDATATVKVNGTTVTSGTASGSINLSVGTNTITTVVTAQDGSTTKTYTVTVTRAAAVSTDANLSNLSLSSGTLSPSFASGTTSYTASVANGVSTITVTPTVSDATATVKVNGTTVTSGTASGTINLSVGTNTITTVVTAQDSTTTKTYTVTVTRAAAVSTDANLANLSLSSGTLSPSFASGTTSYTASVANGVSTITVTPTVSDATATVKVNGTTVTSGTASGTINLSVGTNTITTVVTAQDSTTTKTYTVTVTRAAAVSTDANLANLSLSSGTLSPSFASGTTSYTASVANGVTSLTVTPTVSDATATVTVNGTTVTSGTASSTINLSVGTNTITTVVTAQDGSTTKTYTVTVTRAAAVSTDANLANLSLSSGTLSPSFASGTTSYTASVANGVSTITVTPTVSDATATVTVNGTTVTSGTASGSINLSVGTNTITTVVTAQDGTTTKTYTVTVTRAAPVTLIPQGGALASGNIGQTYSQNISATGGTSASGPYTFSVTGSLPAGLTLSAAGAITGIPMVAGESSFTVTAKDADGTTGSAVYTLLIEGQIILSPGAGSLSSGIVGTPYSQGFSATGGKAPYSFAVSGTLPTGLSLSSNGALSGTPTAAANASFTVTVTDADRITASGTYSLAIVAAAIKLSPNGGELAKGMAGEQYSQPITATGGVGATTFSLVSGTLPKGMSLNLSTGELTGPLEIGSEGDYSFVLQARDSTGNLGIGSYSLKVAPRSVTVTDKQIEVQAGSTPADVPLHRGATGGPFVTAEKTFVEPPNAGTATIIRGQFAQATTTTPVGWYLQFTPNPSYAGQVRVGFRLTSALGVSNTGTVTYTIAFDKKKVTDEINGLVEDFVRARQNLLASTIKVPDLMKRRRLETAKDPVTTRIQPSASGVTLGFSTSLVQMESAGSTGTRGSGGSLSPFNIWIDGTFMAHNREQNGDRWGSFAMISTGADYLVTDKLLLGLSFHYDRMTDPTDKDAELTGNGWLAGPYASMEIAKGVFWNANVLYGGSVNDIETEFWDGDFDTSRWLFDSSINGEWRLDADTVLVPKLRAVYLSETVKDYAVNNAQGDRLNIKGFTTEQLRVSLGADLSRDIHLENGMVLTPRIGVTGGYSGLDGSGVFGQVSAGLSLNAEAAWTLDFDLLFNIDNDGERSPGARARIGGRF
jgi:hypothetical protein